MRTRLEYATVIPDGYRALSQVSAYLTRCGLESGLLHLVYLRVFPDQRLCVLRRHA